MNGSKPLQPDDQLEQGEELRRENNRLVAENEGLKKKIEGLEEELRASKRQAAPFSKGQRKTNPKPPGRKAGQRAFSGIGRRRRSPLAARSWKRQCRQAAQVAAERWLWKGKSGRRRPIFRFNRYRRSPVTACRYAAAAGVGSG